MHRRGLSDWKERAKRDATVRRGNTANQGDDKVDHVPVDDDPGSKAREEIAESSSPSKCLNKEAKEKWALRGWDTDDEWWDMSVSDRQNWEVLGYTQNIWQYNRSPATNGLDWDELSAEEQAAASALMFTQISWDESWDESWGYSSSSSGNGNGPFLLFCGGAVALFLLYDMICAKRDEDQWKKIHVTKDERAQLEHFLMDLIKNDPAVHASWKTQSNQYRARNESEIQARSILVQLRKVFLAVHEFDPGAQGDSDELLITAQGWVNFCQQRAKAVGDTHRQRVWAEEHDTAVEALFRAADLDNNGGISFDEFVSLMVMLTGIAQGANPDHMVEMVWMLLDKDHDGELTREELNQFGAICANFHLVPSEKESWFERKWAGKMSKEMFDEADLNGDGVVSKEEFKATIGIGPTHLLYISAVWTG